MDDTIAGELRVKIIGGTVTHKETGRALTIGNEPRVIGRGSSCHLRIDDPLVSTAHCELVATDGALVVRDLGSENGTWVSGLMLEPTHAIRVPVATTLRLGDTALELVPKPAGERSLQRRFGVIESRSTAMQLVLESLRELAQTNATVHITGESGTGKGYIAKAIHNHSSRASKPFVLVDCTAIAANLVESELFGYEPGAFTGATRRKESPAVEADGGTLFIDEVGELPLEAQGRLLRLVDEQVVKKIGSNEYRKVNIRIVSATLRDIRSRVNAGLFREDLYSRLTAVHVTLPPLRDRPEDIEPLAQQICWDLGHPEAFDAISTDTLIWMKERDWAKGNVRHLRQVLEVAVGLWKAGALDVKRAYLLAGGDTQRATAMADARPEKIEQAVYDVLTAEGTSREAVVRVAERIFLQQLLRETNGNVSECARRADVALPTMRSLLSRLGLREIEPPRRKAP